MPSKKPRIKLYADECFPVTSSLYLKSKGISIIHAYDLNLIRKSDKFHLEKSKKLYRILITLDRDFISYGKQNLKGYSGVIIISVGSATSPSVNKVLDKVLNKITTDYIKGSLVKITASKIIKIKEGKQTERII